MPYFFFYFFFFFFNDTATTEIYTLSLHDALPIFGLDVLGIRRRLLPRGHAFLSALPRPMQRLWALTLTAIVLEVVLSSAMYDRGPEWWWLATQLWSVSAPLIG